MMSDQTCLKDAREAAGIRQEDAAKAIGVSRPTLVSIEQGVLTHPS